MDAFMSALFGAKEVKASARVKNGNETRTVSMRDRVPTDTSDEAFIQAARDGGVNLSVKVNSGDDRGKTFSGKGVFGAAAASATASVLGFKAEGDVPEPVKKRGRSVEPSTNGDGAK
jgi:hypothetical protein